MLPDRPPHVTAWRTGLKPELLQALGTLAVVSAEIEETLHMIYWKHAGLDGKSGPIITDNLNPKRLTEDILKLVALDKSKANVHADLKVLFAEFQTLNTKRNHCLHWIWEKVEQETEGMGFAAYSVGPIKKLSPYRVKRPIYRQSGVASESFDASDVDAICQDCSWLAVRLRSHTLTDDQLREQRAAVDQIGTFSSPAMTFADLFWPAPWLDRPPLPADS